MTIWGALVWGQPLGKAKGVGRIFQMGGGDSCEQERQQGRKVPLGTRWCLKHLPSQPSPLAAPPSPFNRSVPDAGQLPDPLAPGSPTGFTSLSRRVPTTSMKRRMGGSKTP
ncbi:hypothetical protein TWF106_001869 [Orbilia oligospora]|uniref:Uncharacterized protein n=1 Tax=Orbilia oligospora TaxID=2813651 RepID=A0A7C8U828_ORBOL|nr:hypothetical protein TWF106_001869 [Orbilia oligospora]KAF3206247.1 hypothetical protein TWF679_008769 [Orbilia oligospora]